MYNIWYSRWTLRSQRSPPKYLATRTASNPRQHRHRVWPVPHGVEIPSGLSTRVPPQKKRLVAQVMGRYKDTRLGYINGQVLLVHISFCMLSVLMYTKRQQTILQNSIHPTTSPLFFQNTPLQLMRIRCRPRWCIRDILGPSKAPHAGYGSWVWDNDVGCVFKTWHLRSLPSTDGTYNEAFLKVAGF